MGSSPASDQKFENIVIDSTVLLASVMTPDGAAAAAIKKARENYTIVLSPETLQELKDKANSPKLDKFVSREDRIALCKEIENASKIVPITQRVQVCRDPNDDMFVETALSTGAKQILAYDNALLKVNGYEGIAVRDPNAFLQRERELDLSRAVFLEQKLEKKPAITFFQRVEQERREQIKATPELAPTQKQSPQQTREQESQRQLSVEVKAPAQAQEKPKQDLTFFQRMEQAQRDKSQALVPKPIQEKTREQDTGLEL